MLTHVCAARLSPKRTLSCVMFPRDIWLPACSVFPLNCEAVCLDVHSAIFANGEGRFPREVHVSRVAEASADY